MSIKRLVAIGFILVCTTAAWVILGGALTLRTDASNLKLLQEVSGNWGARMAQKHPSFFYLAPSSTRGQRSVDPVQSRVKVNLSFDPKKKGLLWYRTYRVGFDAEYVLKNPTPITQTFYVNFLFPTEGIRYDAFALDIGGKATDQPITQGGVTEAVILDSGAEVPVRVRYQASGMDRWDYRFGEAPRVSDFALTMRTDFREINMPEGAESPTSRQFIDTGWELQWDYADVIGARAIGMDMPAVVNPGPVAARITFFAPVSLLFYFSVLVILGMARYMNLHPMNYFFLAAGCFAFQLLFAYLVDLIPAGVAFVISALVSLTMVTGYLWGVAGIRIARISAVAQFAYMVLFSYSFFFSGLTGITITIGAIITLAVLMVFTARVNWEATFASKRSANVDPPVLA